MQCACQSRLPLILKIYSYKTLNPTFWSLYISILIPTNSSGIDGVSQDLLLLQNRTHGSRLRFECLLTGEITAAVPQAPASAKILAH